jgi:hydroxymethylpyrimidine pyrophosphatase-like HAD family hydrolase
MVCADGGVHACPRTAQKLWQSPIRLAAAERAAHAADELELASFVFLHHEIHADARGERWLDYVRTWTPRVHVHDRLALAEHWRSPEDVAVVLAIGPRERVEASEASLRRAHGDELTLVQWRAGSRGEHWALMARPAGVDKGSGLASLAAQLGVERAQVCAVGDWFNDVPMFAFAGRSFVMGQSVPEVKQHATDQLAATSDEGGGVAEAIERWLR